MTAKRSDLEQTFLYLLRVSGLPQPIEQFRFHPVRKWRADFAYPDNKILIEVDGGTWSNGRHTRGDGYAKDAEKYNTATLLGWKVYRFTGGMIEDGTAIQTIKKAIGA